MTGFRKTWILFLVSLACIALTHGTAAHAAEDTMLLPETVQERHIYEVNPDGTGDFVAIQEGVDSVKSGDTLVIYPGVYRENVVIEDKTVNLIGVSPEHCILTANSDNYHHIPLTIAAGRVYGLTICGTGTGESQDNIADVVQEIGYNIFDLESVYAWQDVFPGYVIHVDHDYGRDKTLSIEKCRIISENNYCIGIGCRSGMDITIEDCELISKDVSGCLFIHNSPVDIGMAQVSVKNSCLKSYHSCYVMAIHSEGVSNPVDLTFQNVKVYAVAYENNDCYSRNNINTWYSVEQLESPHVQAFLETSGFTTSLQDSSQLVHRSTLEQHRKFNKALEEQDSLLDEWPLLEEGITYWECEEDMPLNPQKKRYIIDVKNIDGTVGDGWSGLSGIYLTKDSYGCTLPEMNYPKPVAELEYGKTE